MGNIFAHIFATETPLPAISFIFKDYDSFFRRILDIKKQSMNKTNNYLIHYRSRKGILENVVWEENCNNNDDGKFINYIQKLVIDLTESKNELTPQKMTKILCIETNFGYVEKTFNLNDQIKIFEFIEDILTSISAIKKCSQPLLIRI